VTVWFTSDLHFGHRKVAEVRGFETTEQHDEALVDHWEDRVRDADDVWILGDLAASSPTYALGVLAALPGRKHLISGNHDRTHPMHRDAHNWQRRYLEVFESVQPFARRRIEGEEVLLSHFPYERDRAEPRHLQYRLRDEGLPLLHGHTHGRERLTTTLVEDAQGLSVRTRVEVHVGLDAWGLQLIPLSTIAELLAPARKDQK
jgi:calcineurin-like phosphoesterase family protein